MSSDGFHIEGLEGFYNDLLRIATKECPEAVEAWGEAIAMQFMKRVAENANVDGGRLRASFEAAGDGISGEDSTYIKNVSSDGVDIVAGSNVEYADHVNTGHKLNDDDETWWEGSHYFDDAYDEVKQEIPRWLTERLKELFDIG